MTSKRLTDVFCAILLATSCFCVLNISVVEAQMKAEYVKSSQYEYLKPKADADNADFNQVYFKTETERISVLWSMTMEGNWLTLNYFFKNNSEADVNIKLADAKFNYGGNDLYLYEGHLVPYDQDNLSAGSFLGLNEINDECSLLPGDVCIGEVYAAIPQDFSNGSKVSVRIPLNGIDTGTDFIFERGWMSGEAYRNKKFQTR